MSVLGFLLLDLLFCFLMRLLFSRDDSEDEDVELLLLLLLEEDDEEDEEDEEELDESESESEEEEEDEDDELLYALLLFRRDELSERLVLVAVFEEVDTAAADDFSSFVSDLLPL